MIRLDKYLKIARILKRRTVSNAIAKQEKILVNNRVAKPAQRIKPQDLITIQFGNRTMTIRVLSIDVVKNHSDELLYEVVDVIYKKNEIE